MPWFTDRVSFSVAVVLYAASSIYSVFLWRRGFRRDNWVNYVLLATAFVFHMLAMGMRGYSLKHCPVHNLFEASMFIGWALAGACVVLGLWPRLRFLGAFASPVLFCLGALALFPELDVRGPKLTVSSAPLSLHAALILLSYGAFGLSCAAAMMYLSQQHNLKFNKLRAVLALLPPIERLERVITWMLLAGWLLLTAGLAITPVLMHQKFNTDFRVGQLFTDAKVVWSVLVWVLYATLLIAHWRMGHRGRWLAWSAVGSFAFVMLTFWGTQLLSGIHNS